MAYERVPNNNVSGEVCKESLRSRLLGVVGLLKGMMTPAPIAQYRFLANEAAAAENMQRLTAKLSEYCSSSRRADALAGQAQGYLETGIVPADPGHWRVFYAGDMTVVLPDPFESVDRPSDPNLDKE